MKKFNANLSVRVNVNSEIQADSIEEARSLIEDEISNAFQVNYLNESDEAIVLSICAFEAEIDETYGELLTRLSHLAAIQIAEWAERIASGNYPRKAQNEEWATYASKIERSETELYFHEPEHVVFDRFRAFTPSPACFLNTSKGRIKLSQVRLREVDAEQPGTVISVSPLLVGVGTGALELVALQPEGKPKMSGEAWANGQRIKVGDSLVPDSQ